MRAIVRIGDDVRSAGIKAGNFRGAAFHRRIVAGVNSERSTRGEAHDGIELPTIEQKAGGAGGAPPTGKRVRSAENEAVGGVKKRRTMLGSKIEGILRQVVFAGDQGGSGARDVEG